MAQWFGSPSTWTQEGTNWDEAVDDIGGHGEVLRIAGAGVLPGPAATAA